MALNHSPSIVTNGLVFAYDMGNTKKSWKGAPTTNLFASNLSATNSTRTIALGIYQGQYNGWQYTGVGNDNPRIFLYNSTLTVLPSTFYTLSCLYWSSNDAVDDVYIKFSDTGWPESSSYIQPFTSDSTTRNGSFSVTNLGFGWKYCVGTFQTLATTTTLQQLFFDIDNAGVQVFISNIQLEQQLFATPFVSGTRSTTQTILDQTNRTTTTTNNLTYTSDGTFNFIGGDATSTITVPLSTAFNKLTGTIGMWVNPTSYSGSNGLFVNRDVNTANAGDWFWIGSWDSANVFYFRLGDGSSCCSNDLTLSSWASFCPTNTWTYVTCSWASAGTSRIYTNGILRTSRNISAIPATNPSATGRIGLGHEAPASWNGKIAVTQIYNRQLTDSEILSNFSSMRGRFNV